MTIGQFLIKSEVDLKQVGINSSRLDILILLEDSLHKDRSWVLAHPEHQLDDLQLRRLARKISKRSEHTPLAYIRGHTDFYGRKFKVNRHTLEPRPESETMIELLMSLDLPERPAIADVGTGCGALGITAALEIPNAIVDLYDIAASALAVAKHNTVAHELYLHCRKMNLISRPLRPYDVILANLPYVPTNWKINEAAMAEPKIAIFGGKDGLDVYRKLFAQLQRFTWRPKFVLTEALPLHHLKLTKVAVEHGFKHYKSDDFIQAFTRL